MVPTIILSLLIILSLFIVTNGGTEGFTCQGNQINEALSACPDGGQSLRSSGGNVTAYLKFANNLPNRDFSGPSAGVSDPYVKFIIGDKMVQSSFVRNTLNPSWNYEPVNLGVLNSATYITVEIWDFDVGIEGADDILVRSFVRVPFCHSIDAPLNRVECPEVFGCVAEDSAWKTPLRQMCNESGIIQFVKGKSCLDGGICLYLDFVIVPFQMTVEIVNEKTTDIVPYIGVAGNPYGVGPYFEYGKPFANDASTAIDVTAGLVAEFRYMKGALIMRQAMLEKAVGYANEIKFWAATNFRSYIYICRDERDNEMGIPKWITEGYSSLNRTATRFKLKFLDGYFECFFHLQDATMKNRYGGVKSGAIPFYTNTIPGFDGNAQENTILYNNMYVILAILDVEYQPGDDNTIYYDSSQFIEAGFTYGVVWGYFMFLIARLLNKIDFRIDRMKPYITGLKLTGLDKSLVATLFLTYGTTPCNIEFRAHLFHTENIFYFLITVPIFLLVGWGVSCSYMARPPALGFAITFCGMGSIFAWIGYRLWQKSNWLMSPIVFACQCAAALLMLCFILCVIFIRANKDGYISLPALSLLFGAINTAPLILLTFHQDKTYKNNLRKVIDMMADATFKIKNPHAKPGKRKYMPLNKLLHALLGDCYALNPKVPYFRFATVLDEPPREKNTDVANKEDEKSNKSAVVSAEEEEEYKADGDLYKASLLILFIYLMIAIAKTTHPSIAFLNCLTLVLFDTINTAISHGDINWSPGYKIFLLLIGRVIIMSSGTTWLINYSVAYAVYSISFVQEMINAVLPRLSKRQASEVAFGGNADSNLSSTDLAGSAYFSFGLLTFAFIAIMVVTAKKSDIKNKLPTPYVDVWFSSWPVYAFGLIAICAIIIFGLAAATIRAFYLQKHNLLRGWARDGYMLRKTMDAPKILAFGCEVAILSSGLLIYSATGSSSMLILSIYVPIIAGLLGYAYNIWVSNDYDLVIWPPIKKDDNVAHDSPSDMEVAFHMIENLFGEEQQGNQEPETIEEGPKTLKGFKLPALEATSSKIETSIKMPALPLKSVLRRKRQNLGIKTNAPVVKDLRARDGVDADKFGTGDDVLDLNDPWSKFEDDDDDDLPKRKKKTESKYKMVERGGFLNHPYLVMLQEEFMKTKIGQLIAKYVGECITFIKNRTKKHAKVDDLTLDDIDNDEEDGEKKEEGENQEDHGPGHENYDKMPFWSAVAGGYLSWDEYKALFSFLGGLFMTMIMGITLAATNPSSQGHVIWFAIITFICVFSQIIKYVNTFVIDKSMMDFGKILFLAHFLFVVCYFAVACKGDIGISSSLWILDYFFYFPIFLYMLIEVIKWRDLGYKIEKLDKDGDGDVSYAEAIEYFKMYPVILILIIILVWQMFLWWSQMIGQICLMMFFVTIFAGIFIRDWAVNDFYVSAKMRFWGNAMLDFIMFVTFLVGLLGSGNPIMAWSVFFFAYLAKKVAKLLGRFLLFDPDSLMFFSPCILPVYSYNPTNNDIVDESDIVKVFLSSLLACFIWSVNLAIFLNPVDIGVCLCCICLLAVAAFYAWAVCYVPQLLGKYSSMISIESIADAAQVAKEMFDARQTTLTMEMNDYDGEVPDDVPPPAKTNLDKLKERMSLSLAAEVMDNTKAISFVRDDEGFVASKVGAATLDKPKSWLQNQIDDIKEQLKKFFEVLPMSQLKGWRKHSEAMYDLTDAIAEALIIGKGPLGFLGCGGTWYRLFKRAQEYPALKFLQQPWLNAYDDKGNNKMTVLLSDKIDSIFIFNKYKDLDAAIDYRYKEESRCAIHFLTLLCVAADAKVQREQVLFQKFLRENRFRLASNGISPPAEIFSSSSFASIDIPLVAVWLSTLTSEERERFHMLKATFSDEQKERDEAIDNADYQMAFEAQQLKQEREQREKEVAEILNREIARRQNIKIQEFTDTLYPVEKSRFNMKRDEWISNADCYIDPKDQPLYEKYRAACVSDLDEATEWARNVLSDIEAAQKDCRIGEYGRPYQFVDSEFPPGDTAIGDGKANQFVIGWRCSPGISDSVQLFGAGTDPDDVQEGIMDDAWLLSAISMLAAAGGVGDGEVDPQVLNLFVGHYTLDGDLTHHSEVGGYCVRLHKQGIWNPVIVDDLFPMLRHENWTNENRGMASAHSKECSSIWVSLIEKAYAKYYGSYGELEKGYVHHALEDLTGCEAECITLAGASRGIGKRALWNSLLRYRSNGYILGAGTGSSALADKDILEMGIVFNAAYTIYEIKEVDGNKLIQLRNPPGDHDEWKGDWSDKSDLWTKRLKVKCGMKDEDDNTFFMSFDDFCNVFRLVYVCKWYSPERWHTSQLPGLWKKATDTSPIEAAPAASTEDEKKKEIDKEAAEKEAERARARIDTAGGLPTVHNPGCFLENNPQYTLLIDRPTELRINVSQSDSRGRPNPQVHPFSILVCKNSHPKVPTRINELTKENLVICTPEPKAERERVVYANLNPGIYVVIVATYVAGMEGNFTISLLSNYRNEITPLWPPRWMMKGAVEGAADAMIEKLGKLGGKEAMQKAQWLGSIINRTYKKLVGGEEEEAGNDDDSDKDSNPDYSKLE